MSYNLSGPAVVHQETSLPARSQKWVSSGIWDALRLVVVHDGDIGVLQQRVDAQHGVVRLHLQQVGDGCKRKLQLIMTRQEAALIQERSPKRLPHKI